MLTTEHAGGTPSVAPPLVDDIGIWLFFPRRSSAEEIYIVGSITADRYLTVPGSKLFAVRAFLEQIDGRRTLEEARDHILRQHGIDLNVGALHRKFAKAGLVPTDRGGPGDLQAASAELVRLPIGRLLRAFGRFAALGPIVTYSIAFMIAASLALAAIDPGFAHIAAKTAGAHLSLLGGLPAMVVIAAVSIVAHELSHCYAASCWGILSGSVKVQLYLGLIPIVGLKLAGLYTLPPRGRLAVWGAGVFFNLAAASSAMLALRTIAPESHILQTAAAFNWILVIFNLMPLLPSDGYFLLSTIVRDSNVRVRAWDWLRRPLQQRRTPSLFVLAYVVATVWLLVSALIRLVGGIVNAGGGHPLWRPALSAVMLIFFLLMLGRTFRRTEGSE